MAQSMTGQLAKALQPALTSHLWGCRWARQPARRRAVIAGHRQAGHVGSESGALLVCLIQAAGHVQLLTCMAMNTGTAVSMQHRV